MGWQESLSYAAYRIGDVLVHQNAFDDAVAAYRECLDITTALLAKVPDDSKFKRDLAICKLKMADALRRERKFDEALAATLDGIDSLKDLVTKNPSNNWYQRDLAVSEPKPG